MNPHACSLEKPLDMSAISSFTIDDLEFVDDLPRNGRAKRLAVTNNQPGGLCSHANEAARTVAPNAALGLASVCGESGLGEVYDALDPLQLKRTVLVPIPNKRTNRARVTMSRSGERQIIHLEGAKSASFDDVSPEGYRRVKALISQSRAVVIGHLPFDLTEGLIEWARHVGTLVVLCPGASQFGALHNLRPHVFILNEDEARAVTGCTSDSAKALFTQLNRRLRADQAVIMTMGPGPVFVADRIDNCEWILPPLPARSVPDVDFCMPVGCGDKLAGPVALVLGQPRRLVGGELLRDAVALGQAVATAHYFRNTAARDTMRADYEQLIARMAQQPLRSQIRQAA